MIQKLFILIIYCFSISHSFAEDSIDLNQITRECIVAAKRYQIIQYNIPYKVLHTVEYEGWSGDSDNFQLSHPVKMTIKYEGLKKTGSYWFKNKSEYLCNFKVKSDSSGNIEMIEELEGRFTNYSFHGLMKDGVIKGLWEKGDGKKAYAFYVKAIKK